MMVEKTYKAGDTGVYFYIPKKDWDLNIPDDPDVYFDYKGHMASSTYCWIVQTYLRLKKIGFPCKAVSELPEKGIIFTMRFSIPDKYFPEPEQMIVFCKADNRRHPFGFCYVFLTYSEPLLRDKLSGVRGGVIPHWPQPGLMPRRKSRGERFENIVFMGDPKHNLAAELQEQSWSKEVNKIGLRWHVVKDPSKWSDFSWVDAIVAVRSFDKRRFPNKPATKLFNAWLAGVPAVLGKEAAYRENRKSFLDYIEVGSRAETIEALRELKGNNELRQRMTNNGAERSQEFSTEKITKKWIDFIKDIAIPSQGAWRVKSRIDRRVYYCMNLILYKFEGLRIRVKRRTTGIQHDFY